MIAPRRGVAAIAVLGATGLAATAWASLVEPRLFALRQVSVPALTPGSGTVRILHLSDLHRWGAATHLDRFVRWLLETTGPDLVVATGDHLGGDDVAGTVAVLRDPPAPAIAVLGSNDRYGPTWKNPLRYVVEAVMGRREPRHAGAVLDTAGLVRGLEGAGWQVPVNRRLAVETRAGAVEVLALDDPHIGRDRPELLDRDAPADDPVLRLGLVHAPYRRAIGALHERGCHLVLSGHTHGGQVRVPGIGALVTNCDLDRRDARGLSGDASTGWLHVSAGLGVARTTPLRLSCRPEASVIDVVAAPPADRPGWPHGVGAP